jgi:hypothetical protein
MLFARSLAENIRYGAPQADAAAVEAAARAALVHDFATALPQRYDTVVGEGGYARTYRQQTAALLVRSDVPPSGLPAGPTPRFGVVTVDQSLDPSWLATDGPGESFPLRADQEYAANRPERRRVGILDTLTVSGRKDYRGEQRKRAEIDTLRWRPPVVPGDLARPPAERPLLRPAGTFSPVRDGPRPRPGGRPARR